MVVEPFRKERRPMKETVLPVVLITPESKAALEIEAERTSASGDIVGGLLFGYPLDERRRLVVGSVKPRPEVHFGQREFCIDQSRTSQQLRATQKLVSEQVNYCGVWYVHRTPTGELTDEEWVQAQRVLEDPDYRFKDMVCLVLCLYGGDLKTRALFFDRYRAARGQLPVPTVLRLTTEEEGYLEEPQTAQGEPASPPPDSRGWYENPQIAERLEVEHKWLVQRYRVESSVAPDGKVIFRLMPQDEYRDMVFYMACGPGFPDKAPVAFLVVRGDQYPLLSPALNEWTADNWLYEIADNLVEWQVKLLDQQVAAAEEAIDQGNYKEASDRLAMVLLINPRMPGAARLLARAEAMASESPKT
jgi:hypothetical protein